MRSWSFAKGHGTQNDFVLVVDRHGMLDPSEADVRWLCDRRAGIGADGLLRAIKAEHVPQWQGDPGLWFMDYRNADGSVAEMCGNGVRVFVRHLLDEGLLDGHQMAIGTRSGLRAVDVGPHGWLRVEMGPVRLAEEPVTVRLEHEGQSEEGRVLSWPATEVDVGNPHAVVLLDPEEDLATLPIHRPPGWEPVERFPHGTNVEWVSRLGERHLRMRVHERGSGETRSCGTGTVAAAAALARATGAGPGTWRVDVPGGTVQVELAEGRGWLSGPAEIVARGEVLLPDA